jgi:hypothetical protein
MNHGRSPGQVRRALGKLELGLRGLVLVSVLASMSTAPGAARAQATTVQAPHGLSGSAAWREHIRLGVDFQLSAIEHTQRAFLVGRCSAWKDKFPSQPSPATVTAASEFVRWMTGEAYTELPQEPQWAALRETLPILAKHTFSAEEIAAWNTFRESPEGRRAGAIHEIILALAKVSGRLTDDRSGEYWGWPLARLLRLADAHGFGAELDAAFNQAIGRGTAARLRSISLVPGETPADERMLAKVSRSAIRLVESFVGQVTLADGQAYQRFEKLGLHKRWSDATDAFGQLAAGPTIPVAGQKRSPAAARPPTTTPEFCRRFARSPCPPGGELDVAVGHLRTALAESANHWETSNAAMQIVRRLPSSGCPAPK